jgi:hypothetical protein
LILQKDGGLAGTVLHFILRFFGFWRVFALQVVAIEAEARGEPLQNKSYQKAYGRFFGFCDLS